MFNDFLIAFCTHWILTDFDLFYSTILTAVNLLNGPLNVVGQGLSTILAAYSSMKRIQTFLEMDEKPTIASDEGLQEDRELDTDFAHTVTEKAEDSQTLKIEHASFSWLKDITLSLLPGKLHMCVGPVASVSFNYISIDLKSQECLTAYPIITW